MTREEVEKVLEKIRASLELNGRNVELVDVCESNVHLKLIGACGSCPFAAIALKLGIEQPLKQGLPEVKEVVTVIEKKSHHHDARHDAPAEAEHQHHH
ncbi:MAG: NifU family protein [Chloroflexi bacterium]|nr:NifU family protein [Chloroflexota bacterium]